MAVRITAYPSQFTHTQTVNLDGTDYKVRLQWVARTRGWYLSLFTLDDSAIIEGQRLSAGYSPTAGYRIPDGPPGQFYVRGQDRYEREHLGTKVALIYVTAAEIAALEAAQPAEEVPTVTLT